LGPTVAAESSDMSANWLHHCHQKVIEQIPLEARTSGLHQVASAMPWSQSISQRAKNGANELSWSQMEQNVHLFGSITKLVGEPTSELTRDVVSASGHPTDSCSWRCLCHLISRWSQLMMVACH